MFRSIILWFTLVSASAIASPEKIYYGLEMQDNLVGYMEFEIITDAPDGGDTPEGGKIPEGESGTLIKSKTLALLSLLGQGFDLVADETYRIDKTGRVTFYDNKTTMGKMETGSKVEVSENEARYSSYSGGDPVVTELGPDVLVAAPLTLAFLLKDLAESDQKEKTYKTLNYMDGRIHEVTYTRIGTEDLRLMDRDYACLLFDWKDAKSGESGKVWVDPKTARFVKIHQSTGITLFRALPEVAEQIKRADMNDTLFARVTMPNVDYRLIRFMKIKAKIKTSGDKVTVESLNVPGQRFEGTVKDNVIDGVFEIAHGLYGGEAAPPYPPDFSDLKAMEEYLSPENLIESDDEVIRAKAKKLAEGALDAWDAVCRISCWIADTIVYEIPGGSARQTLDTGKGECGSQSRLLTAMCRSLGIPARVVSGCMFTPYFGGSFGQHAWVEVYMGEAGWIPIDATAREPDFVDSSHIRLGELNAFYPDSMEVLDFSLEKMEKAEGASGIAFNPVTWEPGHSVVFEYTFKENKPGSNRFLDLGTDGFTVKKIEGEGPDAICHVKTELSVQGRTGSTEWGVTRSGKPVYYNLVGKVGDTEYSVNCTFTEEEVQLKIDRSGGTFDYSVPVPESCMLIDNNNLSLFAFLMAGVALDLGKTQKFDAFHVSSSQVMPVTLTPERRETILFDGEEIECTVCSLSLDGYPLKIWLDDQRRILKETEQNGRLVVHRRGKPKESEEKTEG